MTQHTPASSQRGHPCLLHQPCTTFPSFPSNVTLTELTQWRVLVSVKPSPVKTWPRWPPQLLHVISTRRIPYELSSVLRATHSKRWGMRREVQGPTRCCWMPLLPGHYYEFICSIESATYALSTFRAHHTPTPSPLHRPGELAVEGGPPAAAVELHGRRVKRLAAALALV